MSAKIELEDLWNFSLAITVEPFNCDDSEPPCVDYHGDIREWNEDHDDEYAIVGRFRFYVFHFESNPWDVHDAFDHISQTSVYSQLYDEESELTKAAQKACGIEYLGSNSILILDRLEILPEARGKKNWGMPCSNK
jgi:hypothetical protein